MDFYKWYGSKERTFLSFAKKAVSSEENDKRINEFSIDQKKILNNSLSSEFRQWRERTLRAEPGDAAVDLRYCDPDENFILCAQDWNDESILNASAQLLVADKKIAVIIISIPVLKGKLGYQPIPRLLSVRLRPIDGVWKIDGVTDLVVDQWRIENK